MATPPSVIPSWDDNDTNSATPPAQIQNDGLPETSQLPNSYLNWILRWLVEWVQFVAITLGIEFFDVEHDPADGTHTDVNADSVDVAGAATFRGTTNATSSSGAGWKPGGSDVVQLGGMFKVWTSAAAEKTGTGLDVVQSVTVEQELLNEGTLIEIGAWFAWTTAPSVSTDGVQVVFRWDDGGGVIAVCSCRLEERGGATNGSTNFARCWIFIGEDGTPSAVPLWATALGWSSNGASDGSALMFGGGNDKDTIGAGGESTDLIDITADGTLEIALNNAQGGGGITMRRGYVKIHAKPQ